MKSKLFLSGLFFSVFSQAFSNSEGSKMIFEKNLNQWPEPVLFKADIPGGNLFLEQDKLTYNYIENINWHRDHRNESGGAVKVKYHAIKVSFQGCNADALVMGNNLQTAHRNYYIGSDPRKWASNVPLYSEAYYKDLYENIDMHLYSQGPNFKYDFIVHPGANPSKIVLNYKGADGLRIENGHLFIKTSVYDLIEQKPYAYQDVNGVKVEIPCHYVLRGNNLSFAFSGSYDPNLPLIIDPTLIASTYSGSFADNWGFTATYDAAQNIYMAGIAARAGYPYTAGAWDQTFNGGLAATTNQWPFDISISKFNPTGSTLLFATYYGGSVNEQPHSLMVNSNNEMYVVGRTNSPDFPKTAGAYGNYAGGYDIIVGKFNTVGNLLASSIVGGTLDDCVNFNIAWTGVGSYGTTKFNYTDDGRSEVILDNNSNVYVAACTKSTNFPTVSPYQAAFGGVQDAVVFKMNANLTGLTFSTYLGGAGTDAAYGLKLDNSNNVYVTGGTTGSFPTTAGVLFPAYQGGLTDAFIAVLSANGSSLLRSTYLGTAAYDQAYLIEIDASGDLYVYGQTQGNYPTTAGVYSNAGGGMFIHKVSGLLNSTVFSTKIGTGANAVNLSPTAFLVDSCQTIYISGWGRSSVLSANMPNPSTTTGLFVTPNAHQPTTDGKDFYFMVLKPNATGVFYATFYGEGAANQDADHVDGGTSRFDKRGVIYHACCASCGGTSGFPTTPTAYSKVNNGQVPPPYTGINCNEAVVKMDVSVKPLAVANLVGSPNGCVPHTVTFNNSGSQGSYYIWDFGDGSPLDTIVSPSHTYSFIGTYTLTLYAIDSIGLCGFIDTATVIVNVGQPAALTTNVNNIPCFNGVGSATVTASGGYPPLTYAWNTAPVQSSAIATGLTAGTYTATVTDAVGCTSTTTVTITNPPQLTGTPSTVGSTCGMSNGSACISPGGGTPGYTYNWSSGSSSSCATGLAAGPYTYTVTDSKGCTVTGSTNVSVANGPTVTTTVASNVLCNGGSTGSASATQTGGTAPYTYLWSNGQTNQVATGLLAGTYTVVVADANNCSASNVVNITEPPVLAATLSSTNALCFGQNSGTASVVASGGTPGYNYNWSPSGGSGPNANNLGAGTYTVTITDANGCTTQQTTTISQPTQMTLVTTASGTSCGPTGNGVASATPSGGTQPYTYQWAGNPVQTTQTISNLLGGTYFVTIFDANGCTSTGTAVIPTSIQPTALFSYTPAVTCEGISYAFTDHSLNAVTWLWNFGDGTTSTAMNPVHTFPYNGTYNVSMIVTNPPCKDTFNTVITIGDMTSGIVVDPKTNVFTPNADNKNDCFHPSIHDAVSLAPVDTLVDCMFLQVFDRWGVKMFESDSKVTCWDGNVQKTGKPATDGTYYYIAKLGKTEIKGYVTLLRTPN